MRSCYDHTIALLVAFLLFVVVLVFGLGWVTNLGNENQAKIVATCAVHTTSPICRDEIHHQNIVQCESLADDAADTAGVYAQAFSALDWQAIYNRCIGGKS